MQRVARIARAASILLLLTAAAQAADIKVVVPEVREKTSDGWVTRRSAVITLSGQIEKGDDVKFNETAGRIKSATVYLDSRGGNVFASLAIGEIIRRRKFHTAVLNYMNCVSGCALAWLGGTKRYLGGFSQVGFYGPFIKRDLLPRNARNYDLSPATAMITRIIGEYVVNRLKLKKEAAGYVTMAPPEKLTYLTQEDGERYGIEFTRMNVPGYDPLP